MGVSRPSEETVIVVMGANPNIRNPDALVWALDHVVRPGDAVVVLAILSEPFSRRKAAAATAASASSSSSCLPNLYMGIGISSVWERLEFSVHGDVPVMTPELLEDQITKMREEFQNILYPFRRRCQKNNVMLEIKIAAGICPKKITIDEAQNTNTRWIVLDSQLKKDSFFIHENVSCYVAVMKENGIATIMRCIAADGSLEKPTHTRQISAPVESHEHENIKVTEEEMIPPCTPPKSSCFPLSCRPGFPRHISLAELERITNNFCSEYLVHEAQDLQVYQGILQETPVLVHCFPGNKERYWSELKILSLVRHRNILNLVGYCCADHSMFLLCDYPGDGSLAVYLQSDILAKNLPWKARWNIALGICSCLRYLHEECPYGTVVHLSVCSSNIVLSSCSSALLTNFSSSKLLEEETSCHEGSSPVGGLISPEGPRNTEGISRDVQAYGLFMLELITGEVLGPASGDESCCVVERVLPLLANGSITEVMDPRLQVDDKGGQVQLMAHAALLCLKESSASENRTRMSQVEAALRGDKVVAS